MAYRKTEYESWVAKLKDKGVELSDYQCPACDKTLHTQIPESGRVYDTTCFCPYCGDIHFKSVTHDGKVRVA